MTKMKLAALAVLTCTTLGACGYSQGDRALSGAGIGAGAGAAGAAILGANPLAGAALGAGAGAITGAATTHDDVNLGRPAWR